jgi:hypothetical protein
MLVIMSLIKKRFESSQTGEGFNQTDVMRRTNACMSTIGRAFIGAIQWDYDLTLIYEIYQAIPDQLPLICSTSALKNYLKNENITD